MANYPGRIPKKGDRVATQNAPFIVTAVDHEQGTVDLRLIGPGEHRLSKIPWGVLMFLDEEISTKQPKSS
jgi:hypothetical protein